MHSGTSRGRLPVWALLGGRARDKVRLYQSIGGSSPEEAADNAVELRERFGYNACKMSPHNPGDNQMPYNEVPRNAGQRVRAVCEATAPDHDIAVDIHARYLKSSERSESPRKSNPTTRSGWRNRFVQRTPTP